MPVKASKLIEEWAKLSPEEKEKQIEELQLKSKEESENWNKRVSILFPTSINIAEEQAAIAAIEQSDPTNFQQIAATQLELANSYYTAVRIQSAQSFLWSRITSGIGFVFFLVAIIFLIIELGNISYFGAAVSAIGGVLVEVYAGLIQWQGKQAADQAKDYHVRLDRIQRFIIANSACEGIDGSEKKQMRSEIIRKLVE
jgi:hypothetical protein